MVLIATNRENFQKGGVFVQALDIVLEKADVVYTQAVLMHISEDENRFQNALLNIFRAAESSVVLMENWRKHQFFDDIKRLLNVNSLGWTDANIYYAYRKAAPTTRLMIISKQNLEYPLLQSYDELLLHMNE